MGPNKERDETRCTGSWQCALAVIWTEPFFSALLFSWPWIMKGCVCRQVCVCEYLCVSGIWWQRKQAGAAAAGMSINADAACRVLQYFGGSTGALQSNTAGEQLVQAATGSGRPSQSQGGDILYDKLA